MAAGLTSPDVGNLSVGKGFILFKPQGATDFYHVGNVPTFTFTPKITSLDHFSSMEGTRLKDLSVTIEKSGEVKMDMEEITATNLAMLVLGDVSVNVDGETEVTIFSRNSLTGELKYYATNEIGPRWYVDLLSVTFNPSGDFSPITDNAFAKLPVTGTVQAVDGVFGKMVLKPGIDDVVPENVLVPSITGGGGTGGAPRVGDTLTGNVGGWVGVDDFTYLWKVGGTAPGGTPVNEKTYKPVTADLSKTVTVTVTGNNQVGSSTPVTSPVTAAVAAAPAPTLTSVTPSTGVAAGGTAVGLAGTNFTGATGVTLGATPATSFTVVSPTQITCTAPAHAAGAVAVVVQHPSGNATLPTGFTYT